MINIIKYIFVSLLTAFVLFAVYSFINTLNIQKKVDYYKYSNQVTASTFSKTDRITDEYDRQKGIFVRQIIEHGGLTNEQIKYINSAINKYN